MEELKFILKGVAGQLRVYEDRVEIIKRGYNFHKTNKTIAITKITSVLFLRQVY